jgi:hypothetical protein
VIDTASPELFADFVGRCEPEVSDGDMETAIEAENILRFEIAMINTQRVTVLHCIEQLEKDPFDKIIVPEVAAVVKDL